MAECLYNCCILHNSAVCACDEECFCLPIFELFFFFPQGKSQQQAVKHLSQLYWPVVIANWKWFSLLQFINFTFVHPVVSNI